METPEPPNAAPSRPTLLAPARCSMEVQQQILARLEQKAAEKAQMVQIARKSLRVAGLTTAGIGVVVALLVYARHQRLPPAPVVPMVVAPAEAPAVLGPLPALVVDEAREELADSSLPTTSPSLQTVETDPAPRPDPPGAVLRIGKPAPVNFARRVKAARPAAASPRRGSVARKSLHTVAHAAPAHARKASPATKAAPQPLDTDVSLLSALLLHASRPAVVPPAVLRPPCTKAPAPAPPCLAHAPDPQ